MRNDLFLNHPVNKTFEEVLWMSQDDFRAWCIELRKVVVDLWDNYGLPPRVGFTEQETADQFKKMVGFPTHEFVMKDLLTGEDNVIRNTSVIGNAVNDWFPTMMKTKITYTTVDKAKSIYDFFANDDLLETFITYATRHFKRDSFYHYSTPISIGDKIEIEGHVHVVKNVEDFVNWFGFNIRNKLDYGYWLCGIKEDKEYTGYNQELKKKQNLIYTPTVDALNAWNLFDSSVITNVDLDRWKSYNIRLFKYGQKLFPIGLKAFRVSFCQYAVNFPPLTAKHIYETYLPNEWKVKIYDPSMGWAGRLLGAMSVETNRKVLYIGTDPNTDHSLPNGRTKYHEVADFFNKKVRRNTLWPEFQKYEIYQIGSEVIAENESFKKHKGDIDLIFTSPPYFAKEVYSDDPEQSCHKFEQYREWKEGFLRPTLQTCYDWLKPDRYLLWNISDAQFNGELLPLEKDSIDILTSLGMKHVDTLKMTLAQMPGGNRFVETGESEEVKTNTVFGEEITVQQKVIGKMKNYCKIKNTNGKEIFLKYEPIFVFYKPKE